MNKRKKTTYGVWRSLLWVSSSCCCICSSSPCFPSAVFPFVGVSVFASDANVTLLVATRFCFTVWLLATCFLHSAHSVVEFTLWESRDIDCSAFTYMVLSKQLMWSLGTCYFTSCRVTGFGFHPEASLHCPSLTSVNFVHPLFTKLLTENFMHPLTGLFF